MQHLEGEGADGGEVEAGVGLLADASLCLSYCLPPEQRQLQAVEEEGRSLPLAASVVYYCSALERRRSAAAGRSSD